MLDTAHPLPTIRAGERASRVAALAHRALTDELETWPKPGLVCPHDAGSHDDMDAGTFRRSAAAIRPYFERLFIAGTRGAEMADLRALGLRAEAAMLIATSGVNTHRGAIFALGLICAAEGRIADAALSAEQRAMAVGRFWGEAIRMRPASKTSHGGRVTSRYGVGGAGTEAADGFPTIREIGLPALRRGREIAPDDPEAARVHCFFALLAVMDDTNLLHRGGAQGLRAAQAAAARFHDLGGVASSDWLTTAVEIHRTFVAERLSPGGCADLLAATLLLEMLADDRPLPHWRPQVRSAASRPFRPLDGHGGCAPSDQGAPERRPSRARY